jgi:hypothetical protein
MVNFSTVCGADSAYAYNFTLYDEETNTMFGEMNSTFEAVFRLTDATGLLDKNMTFNMTHNFTYPICFTPSFATFQVDATIRYYNISGYSTRYYFIRNGTANNVTQTIRLYLLENAYSSPIQFIIRESDGITAAPNVVIRALRQFLPSDTYETVAMSMTDGNGNAFTYLKMNTVYHKFYLERNGVVLQVIDQGILGGYDVSLGKTLTWSLQSANLAETFTYLGKISGSCAFNTSTSKVTCTFNDTSGVSSGISLYVQKFGSLTWTTVCTNTTSLSAGTLSCNVASYGNGTYYYWIYGTHSPSAPLLISSGAFRIGATNIYGTNGLIIAALLILVLALVGAFNPSVSIVLATVGLVTSYGLGFIDVSLGALVGIVVVAGILIIKNKS